MMVNSTKNEVNFSGNGFDDLSGFISLILS